MTAHRDHPSATSLHLELVLRAPGPAQWLAAHLPTLFGSEAETTVARSPAVSMGDLLADDASMLRSFHAGIVAQGTPPPAAARSEEHTSELQSLMRTSYAVFCLKKKT